MPRTKGSKMCIRDSGNSEYGRSKKAGEELFFQYAQETGAKVAVYRDVYMRQV